MQRGDSGRKKVMDALRVSTGLLRAAIQLNSCTSSGGLCVSHTLISRCKAFLSRPRCLR